jgi:hypothetical protein
VAQSLSSELSGELVRGPRLTHSVIAHGPFADRWRKRLPRRWARNGAVFGGIFSYAQVSGSREWEMLLNNGHELRRFAFLLAVMTLSSALTSFLVGIGARRSLTPGRDSDWVSIAGSVVRKWTLGANLLGLLMVLADVAFEWRGPVLEPGGSAEAVIVNIGYIVGLLFGFSVAGLITGLISRRGLRMAIADDELLGLDAGK